jgi:hypothetical protein
LPYLFALREKVTVALSMAIMNNIDMLPIAVFTTADKKEVKLLVEKDPAILAVIFTYKLLFCMGKQIRYLITCLAW